MQQLLKFCSILIFSVLPLYGGVSKIRFANRDSFSLRSTFTMPILTQAAIDGVVSGALSANSSIWWFESKTQKGFRTGSYYFSTSLLNHLFSQEVFTYEQFGPTAKYLSSASAAYISSYASFACFHGLSKVTRLQPVHGANMITNVFMRTLYEDVYSKASRYMSTEVAHAATTAALYAVSNIIAMPLALYATGSTRISTEYINWIMGETPLVAALGFAIGPHGVRIQSSF